MVTHNVEQTILLCIHGGPMLIRRHANGWPQDDILAYHVLRKSMRAWGMSKHQRA